MTPLEALLTEDIPTRIDPAPARPRAYQQYWTAEEQDAHWNALCQAVGTPGAQRPHPAA